MLPGAQAKPCDDACASGGEVVAARSAPGPVSPADDVPLLPLLATLGLASLGALGVVAACRLARRAE